LEGWLSIDEGDFVVLQAEGGDNFLDGVDGTGHHVVSRGLCSKVPEIDIFVVPRHSESLGFIAG
jgi:hypothetical protein